MILVRDVPSLQTWFTILEKETQRGYRGSFLDTPEEIL